ncbi:Tungstate uptake system ATP-binding protein TupC (plasmid) [Pseudoseohaeicola sp. NH-UV-7]|uniref:ATP-binding cassette domain-containing protein n=1 Tax=unclassified Sulfitobacter TaxID=196795 RepID=UPI000E0B9CE8|nr:ATP-binding cassette domain-containing protein [Sulfitobacter sp. JL08]AXI54191.1 ABC transporter ATP-binding protein [Sulfitobacter sp. JL08]
MSDAVSITPRKGAQAQAASALLPLRVRDLTLRFGEVAILKQINLDLGAGGCTIVMGPNGVGKSLFLKLLHGLIPATSGTIDWNGNAPQDATARQAFVFQKPVLLRRSVAANIDFVLQARGKDKSECTALLELAGLAHKARQPARLLSGGEQQRLALARALATDPEVLFLDEPTASLDPRSVLAIERIVRDACARGVRVIFITHDIGQARRLADDVVFLHHGRVAVHAAASDFFPDPPDQTARDYLNGKIVL